LTQNCSPVCYPLLVSKLRPSAQARLGRPRPKTLVFAVRGEGLSPIIINLFIIKTQQLH
jgi:hypothetical protein